MTNTNQQEQLYRLIKELDFYGWKSTGMKENPTDVPMEDVFILRQDVIKILSKPPVEDGKLGGEVVNDIVRIMLDSEMIGYDENMKPQSRQGHLNRTQYRSVAEKIASIKSITW